MIEAHFVKNINTSSGIHKIFAKEISSYNHTTTSGIGYDSCSMQVSINKLDMYDIANWIIGSKIDVYIKDTMSIWSGFVNQVSVSLGGEQITFGPFLDVANKVLVKYTEYTTGVPGVTTYGNNTLSQSKYGFTITKILNAGNVSAINAEKIRDRYLDENSYHKIGKSISQSGSLSFNIECLGYYHLLDTYNYNVSGTTIALSTKIKNVLAAQPNSFFSTNYYNITTNNLSVSNIENNDRLASEVIKELVVLGAESTDDKMIFGIYGNNARYEQPSSQIMYFLENNNRDIIVSNIVGGKVEPWDIKPGLLIESVGDMSQQVTIGFNRNVSYISAINYTYPYQFQITSGDSGKLSQQLAKLGLGGL